jgi:DNA-binding NarL/FixJ family response regulator
MSTPGAAASTAPLIRVLVVDDHPLVRHGLAELLNASEDMHVVGSAEDGDSAAAAAADTLPDVVLMDLSMVRVDGLAATRAVLAAVPDTRVIVLTSFCENERILDALDAGAIGYLLKDSEPGDILRAVRDAAAGDAPLSPRAARALLPANRRGRANPAALSARESEVLALVAAGLPNKAVARRLGISEKTVKAHLTRVFAVLGVQDRTSAALWAQRHGVVA